MNRQSTTRAASLAIVTCLTALAVVSPGAPATSNASTSADCHLPGWTHVLTGHWGGGCR
jgi:hypothetical protein